MKRINEDVDTSIKVSPKALNELSKKAKPFESKKDCLERIIKQNCSPSNEMKDSEQDSQEVDE